MNFVIRLIHEIGNLIPRGSTMRTSLPFTEERDRGAIATDARHPQVKDVVRTLISLARGRGELSRHLRFSFRPNGFIQAFPGADLFGIALASLGSVQIAWHTDQKFAGPLRKLAAKVTELPV